MGCCDIFRAVFARILYAAVFCFISIFLEFFTASWVWIVFVGIYGCFWLFELLYTSVRHKGQEKCRISVSAGLFVLGCLPMIWMLELTRIDILQRNSTFLYNKDLLVDIQENPLFLHLRSDEWLNIIKQLFLLVIILGRILQPSSYQSHYDTLKFVLDMFLAASEDIGELFDCLEDPRISGDSRFPYIILGVFSLSVFHLIFVPGTGPSNSVSDSGTDQSQPCFIFQMENVWYLSLICMELPFFFVRVAILAKYHIYTYNMLFFTVKNALVIFVCSLLGFHLVVNQKVYRKKKRQNPNSHVK